ncbi:MAG: DUF3006 domain-containing protein [Clostridia bacterium]|nr:DUF3006 domain-containing protein [Clostridia bacterium]
MKLIIDRIEENVAVCEKEDGKMIELPAEILPEGAGEGAVIEIVYNEEETLKRKENLKNRLNNLFNK